MTGQQQYQHLGLIMALGLTMNAWPALSGEAGGSPPAYKEALVSGYHLRPTSAVVTTGGIVDLKLVRCLVKGKLRSANTDTEQQHESSRRKKGDHLTMTFSAIEVLPPDGGSEAPVEDDGLTLTAVDVVEVFPPGKNSEPPKKKPTLTMTFTAIEVLPDPQEKLPPHLVCEGDEDYSQYAATLPQPSAPVDVQWRVDGPGRVSGNNMSAIYFAPSSKPSPNEATVTVTFKHPLQIDGKSYPDAKHVLLSRIKILDEINTYAGTFSSHDVSVNEEYTRNLTGRIHWKFDEDYVEGGWREYTGSGTAKLHIKRTGCGAADFADIPVEGRLKVHDDGRYEFLINLVGEQEQTRTCKRPELSEDLAWEETFSSGEDSVSSGDPCGKKEFYPRYTDRTHLSFERKGACSTMVNQYQESWSFRATE